MKFQLFVLPLVSYVFATAAFAAQKLPAGAYEVDKAHSKVGFEVSHLVISTVDGRFTDFSGSLKLADKIEQSSLTAKVSTTTVDTGNAKRDDHLRSPDFFDVKKFPEMTFVSKEFKQTGDDLAIGGTLTIKGTSKPVTFAGKIVGQTKDMSGAVVAVYKGKTTINRQEFGLKWNKALEAGPVVGDNVDILLTVEATKK